MRSQNKLAMVALAMVPFLMVLGNSMLIPVLQEMQSALHISKTSSSLVITLFSIPAGIAIVAAGYLADRYGRKVVIIPAVLLYGLGGLISGLAAVLFKESAFGLVLVGRVVQGIGAAGTAPVAMTMAADVFKNNRTQAMGIIEAANASGKVVSPVAGAALGLVGWWLPFFVYAVLSVPIAMAMGSWTKEPARAAAGVASQPGKYVGKVKQVFVEKGGGLAACFAAGSTVLLILFGVLFYLSEYLEKEHDLEGIPKGLILAIPVLLMCTTAILTGNFLQRHMKLLAASVLTGLGLETVGALLIAFLVRQGWALFVGVGLGSIGAGLVMPALNSLVTGAAQTEQRGMITALYSAVRFFGVAVGPPIFGWLVERGRSLPFWFAVALLLVAGGMGWWLLKPEQLLGTEALRGPLPGQVVPQGGTPWKLPENLPLGTRRMPLGPLRRPPEE